MILLHIVVCIVRVQECLGFEYMQLQYLLLCILSYVIVIFCPGKHSDSKVFYCLLGFRLSPHREHVHAPGCMDDEQKASLVCLQHPETSYGVTGRYGLIAQFVAYRIPFFTLTSLQQVLLGMYSCFCFHASEKATFLWKHSGFCGIYQVYFLDQTEAGLVVQILLVTRSKVFTFLV